MPRDKTPLRLNDSDGFSPIGALHRELRWLKVQLKDCKAFVSPASDHFETRQNEHEKARLEKKIAALEAEIKEKTKMTAREVIWLIGIGAFILVLCALDDTTDGPILLLLAALIFSLCRL